MTNNRPNCQRLFSLDPGEVLLHRDHFVRLGSLSNHDANRSHGKGFPGMADAVKNCYPGKTP